MKTTNQTERTNGALDPKRWPRTYWRDDLELHPSLFDNDDHHRDHRQLSGEIPMKKIILDSSYLAGPTHTTPSAPGSTPTYTSPISTSLPLPTSQTSNTSTALAPKHGDGSLSTEVH